MKHFTSFLLAILLLTCSAHAAQPTDLSTLQDAQPGDFISFGHYPQTSEGNDMTPIEWIVLAREDNTLTLLSRYVLDAKPYNNEFAKVTWETCTLREWLNGEFYSTAFSDQEKPLIQESHLENKNNPKNNTPGGAETDDLVFCLSLDELNQHISLRSDKRTNSMGHSAACIAHPTDYARAQGVNITTLSSSHVASHHIPENMVGTDTCWWWLRSPGYYAENKAIVNAAGAVLYGQKKKDRAPNVNDETGGVRPVIIVQIP